LRITSACHTVPDRNKLRLGPVIEEKLVRVSIDIAAPIYCELVTYGSILAKETVLLPITYAPPSGTAIGIEIPAKVKQAIGLDDAPSSILM
jgi:hypothetical protein